MENVICYINQFFADIGGEDKVDYRPEARDGVTDPTAAINQMLTEVDTQVTTAVICGDNSVNTRRDEATGRILIALEGREFDLFPTGLAFQAGCHGAACDEIGRAVSAKFGVPVITSVHAENPGVEMFKEDMYIVMGSHSAASMKRGAGAMVKLAGELLEGQTPGGPDAEGHYARGIRHQMWREDGVTAADRAVDMFITKTTGQPYQPELTISKEDLVPIAPVPKNLEYARIALANTGGIVPVNNPGKIRSAFATRWGRYDTSKMDRLESGKFKTIHTGFDPAAANADPNVIIPVDVMRRLLNENKYGSLHDYFYPTVGAGTTQEEARRMVKEIISLLREDHVDAVIMVSIWGTCTRRGLTMVKGFERAGFPVVLMYNLLPVVQTAGVDRTVPTISISYPLGNPSSSREEQHLLRRSKVEAALGALATDIKKQTIFKVGI